MSFFSQFFGDAHARYLASLTPLIDRINSIESEFEKLSDADLKDKTRMFQERLGAGEALDAVLPEAFAAAREAAKRTLGQRHFDVQIVGGIALHQGKIAEMKTGEGKTLVATLPLYLNSLAGRGAHLVTPNDYLSRVGAGWMGPVYHALGVSVGVIAHDFSGMYDPAYGDLTKHGDERLNHFRPCTRHEAYEADITYGTNNEFGFDYLRDNLENNPAELRQRGHAYAIVDEVDSILIDEARTPLIISAPDQESADLYQVFSRITPRLKENVHYNRDEKLRAVTMTEEGIDAVEKILNVGSIYEEKGFRFVRYLEQALRAQALFHRDKDYVVRDGEVVIVDEFTGRLMPGRRWSEGLHQAVEAKEGVKVQQESRTLATITFQNYFRMYEKLAGMTGTAQTSAEEFDKVYRLDVITIPTNKPMVREDVSDFVYRTEAGKLKALRREVKARHERGQPVLIGTISVEKSERLSAMLRVDGVPHEILNAKNHEQEAIIIAQAGRRGAVTVSTNMAGRGVDILLGGNPQDAQGADEVRKVGGLHVIGTERHEARRIDNQLRGRSGRQGDPGSSQFFVSMEDDVMRIFGSERIKGMMESLGIPEDQPIESAMISRAIEAAQAKIEGFHFDSRKHVLEYDDVLNKQRDAIYRLRKEILFVNQPPTTNHQPPTLKERIFEMMDEEVSRIVEFHTAGDSEKEWNVKEIFETVKAMAGAPDDLLVRLESAAFRTEGSPEERQKDILSSILEELRIQYQKKEEAIGEEKMRVAEREVLLRSIDVLWMDHLDQMAHLRDSVRLRAYGQRDPLVEYKNEGSRLFRQLQGAIRAQVANTIFKVGGAVEHRQRMPNIQLQRPEVVSIVPPRMPAQTHDPILSQINASEFSRGIAAPRPKEPNRNDPCPCGSGKKYKKCHGNIMQG